MGTGNPGDTNGFFMQRRVRRRHDVPRVTAGPLEDGRATVRVTPGTADPFNIGRAAMRESSDMTDVLNIGRDTMRATPRTADSLRNGRETMSASSGLTELLRNGRETIRASSGLTDVLNIGREIMRPLDRDRAAARVSSSADMLHEMELEFTGRMGVEDSGYIRPRMLTLPDAISVLTIDPLDSVEDITSHVTSLQRIGGEEVRREPWGSETYSSRRDFILANRRVGRIAQQQRRSSAHTSESSLDRAISVIRQELQESGAASVDPRVVQSRPQERSRSQEQPRHQEQSRSQEQSRQLVRNQQLQQLRGSRQRQRRDAPLPTRQESLRMFQQEGAGSSTQAIPRESAETQGFGGRFSRLLRSAFGSWRDGVQNPH